MDQRRKDTINDFAHRAYCNLLQDVLPERYTAKADLSRHLRRIFTRYPIDCVLDVGANEGQYRNFLRRRCDWHGKIVSFEPVRKNVEYLRSRNGQDPRWRVMDLALGDQNTQLEINVMENTEFSSFQTPDTKAVPEYANQNRVASKETVQVRRLDDTIDELSKDFGFQNFYLKLDTQGFDRNVLEGARGTLDRVPALQTEVSVLKLYDNAPSYFEMISYLNSLGFEISGLFPVNRDQYERVVEFDCVAVNSRFFQRVVAST